MWAKTQEHALPAVELCRAQTDEDQSRAAGLILGCHRAGGHPEDPAPEWHLDRSRALWWQIGPRGVPICQRAYPRG